MLRKSSFGKLLSVSQIGFVSQFDVPEIGFDFAKREPVTELPKIMDEKSPRRVSERDALLIRALFPTSRRLVGR